MEENTVDESQIIFEGNTAVWELNAKGAISGSYTGKFRFRCYLSPVQKIAANREYRELLGSSPAFAPEHESNLAFALTQLKYRIIESPPFWSSTKQNVGMEGDIADDNIITMVLDAAIAAEVKFRKQVKERTDNALAKAIAAAEKIKAQQDSAPAEEDESED